MDKEELAVALSNYGWNQELTDTFISKSGAISVALNELSASIAVNGNVHTVAFYEECYIDRTRKVVGLGTTELKAQN